MKNTVLEQNIEALRKSLIEEIYKKIEEKGSIEGLNVDLDTEVVTGLYFSKEKDENQRYIPIVKSVIDYTGRTSEFPVDLYSIDELISIIDTF